MDNTIIASLIGVAGTLTGTLSGIFIGHRLNTRASKEAIKRQEFIKASIEFKEAFFDEIRAFQDRTITQEVGGFNNFANTIIKNSLDNHTRAFFRFKEFLKPDDRIRFHICWKTYICKEETEQYQTVFEDYFSTNFFTCYETKTNTVEEEHDMRDRALQNISELFKFAEF